MAAILPTPAPDSGGIRIGDVGGSVNFSALGDIVGGDKITTITTTIQISVEAVTQRPLITSSPYRGLDRFEDRDKDLFFGRDQLIKSLLAQLSASNVLLVLGASGSGKSSVVRAGLLPQLSQLIGTRFRYFTFVPDVNPFESLRAAVQGAGFSQAQTRELADAKPETPSNLIHTLQRSGDQWLFFVDQFEEIFTVGDEKLRAAFIAALVQIAQDPNSSTKLVLAMRADFLDRFSPFPQFAKIIEKNIDFVADMHTDELRQAIEQPAARHGVVFEQGLVEEIIKDVQGQAGSLPLLQYTLDLLWQEEAREDGLADRHLNTKAYRELGGVRGALQKRADEIYDSFAEGADGKTASPKQEIVRQIFLRLVDLAGEGSNDAAWRPVRRRASIAMFGTTQKQEILQALINQKLLVSNREGDDATVEVAHEALFTSWGRLKNWIDAGKQVIFARNRLADDARRWQRRQQEGDRGADEELLSGSRLAQALDMRGRGDFATVVGGLGDNENLFLDRSAAQREKRARLRRVLEVAGVVLLLISMISAIVAGISWINARNSRNRAVGLLQQSSRSDFLRASELLDQNRSPEALAFLARACRFDPTNSAAATRLFSLLAFRNWILPLSLPMSVPADAGSLQLVHASFSPDAKKVVGTTWTRTEQGQAYVWDATSGKILLAGVPANSSGMSAAQPCLPDERSFSPGAHLLLIPVGKQVQIFDLDTGTLRGAALPHAAEVTAAQFIQEGAAILTGCADGTVSVWNTDGSKIPRQKFDLKSSVFGFSRDGTRAAVVGAPNSQKTTFAVWNLDLTKPAATPLIGPTGGRLVAFSEDGRQLATETAIHQFESGGTHTVTSLTPAIEVSGKRYVGSASFAPGGGALAVMFWQIDTGSDTSQTATAEVRVWLKNPEGREIWEGQSALVHPSRAFEAGATRDQYQVCFSPDGHRIASVAALDAARIWQGADGKLAAMPLAIEREFSDVAFASDGMQLLTAATSGRAQIWDARPLNRTPEAGGKADESNREMLEWQSDQYETKPGSSGTTAPTWKKESTKTRRFQETPGSKYKEGRDTDPTGETELQAAWHLVDESGAPLLPEVLVPASSTVRFSKDGRHFLTIVPADPGTYTLTARDAATGRRLLPDIAKCWDGWLSPAGDQLLVADYAGHYVLDVETGKHIFEIPCCKEKRIDAVAFTPEGVLLRVDGDQVFRCDFHLREAPALLPDIAESVAQLRLDENGFAVPHAVPLGELLQKLRKENKAELPGVFASWIQWLLKRGVPSDAR